ncbi:hypothetical protein [Fulvimarina sp. MAC8]|uniref:hypothetical protein n=1 Tax=Fulvimarina sp. MAC8 TaxID=3162874 RepID=UPI0032F06D2E
MSKNTQRRKPCAGHQIETSPRPLTRPFWRNKLSTRPIDPEDQIPEGESVPPIWSDTAEASRLKISVSANQAIPNPEPPSRSLGPERAEELAGGPCAVDERHIGQSNPNRQHHQANFFQQNCAPQKNAKTNANARKISSLNVMETSK